MTLTLSYYLPDRKIEERSFTKNQIVVGSKNDADLSLLDLAPQHCRIYESTQGWYAEALANDVYINQQAGSGFIRDQDTLTAGRYTFRVQISQTVPDQNPVPKKNGGLGKFLLGCFLFFLFACGLCYGGYRYFVKPWAQKTFGTSTDSATPSDQTNPTQKKVDLNQLKLEYNFDSFPQDFTAEQHSDLRKAAALLDLNEVEVRILEAKSPTWRQKPTAQNFSSYILTAADLLQAQFEGKPTTELEVKKRLLEESLRFEIIQPALQDAKAAGIVFDGDVPGSGELGEQLMGKWNQHQLGTLAASATWTYGFGGMYESSKQLHEERVGPLLAIWDNGIKSSMGVETYEPPVLWMDARKGSGISGMYGITAFKENRMCGYVDWAWTDRSRTGRGIWWAERVE